MIDLKDMDEYRKAYNEGYAKATKDERGRCASICVDVGYDYAGRVFINVTDKIRQRILADGGKGIESESRYREALRVISNCPLHISATDPIADYETEIAMIKQYARDILNGGDNMQIPIDTRGNQPH